MNDIFIILNHSQVRSAQTLTAFDHRIGAKLTDWGIATYTESGTQIFAPERTSAKNLKSQLTAACECPGSKALVARIVTKSDVNTASRQPIVLNFLGRDWLFVSDLETETINFRAERLPGSRINGKTTASSCIFEYLRNRALEYVPNAPKRSLKEAFCEAFSDLLEAAPKAGCSIAFTNGTLSFVFVYHRPVYLCDPPIRGCPTVVSTIRLANKITSRKFERNNDVKAIMLILYNDDLAEIVHIPNPQRTFDRRRKHKCDLEDLADLFRDYETIGGN